MPGDLSLAVSLALVLVTLAAVLLAVLSRREADLLRRQQGARGMARPDVGSVALDVEELRRITDGLGIGLLRVDGEGRIVLANEAVHRLLGRRQGSLPGKTAMEGFVDHRIEELMRRARTAGRAQLEMVSTGEPPSLVVRAMHAARDEGLWLLLEDVSELRHLQRIRAEFIDNLSHELRTPLTTVRLLTESLVLDLERTKLPPRVRDSIEQIDVETSHLAQMVNELLDLTKIEQGEAALEMVELDAGELVERTLDRMRLYAERQRVELRVELPSAAAERTIRADEQRVGQLLINLLHNAVKFSPAGGVVTVRLRPAAEAIVLEVEDRGPGIPRHELERVFERFYKVDRARSREGGGTGLGLAIARHIAERHGGRTWAESEEGQGARFYVELPREPRLD